MLNRDQQRKIEELRRKGMGYKTIATELNISRDAVRNYCKANSMDGYGKDYVDKRYCKYCHKELKQPKTGRKKKFCSATCKVEWEKLHPLYTLMYVNIVEMNFKVSLLKLNIAAVTAMYMIDFGRKRI